MNGFSARSSPESPNHAALIQPRSHSNRKTAPSYSAGSLRSDLSAGSKWYTGPTIAERAPDPTSGQREDGPGGYQRNAGFAGGSSRSPVLLGESLTGCAGSAAGPLSRVPKSKV